jgi:hypothetical protein
MSKYYFKKEGISKISLKYSAKGLKYWCVLKVLYEFLMMVQCESKNEAIKWGILCGIRIVFDWCVSFFYFARTVQCCMYSMMMRPSEGRLHYSPGQDAVNSASKKNRQLFTKLCTMNRYIECPTTYQTRHFFNNSKTNEDIATKQTHSSSFLKHRTYSCSKLVAISLLVLKLLKKCRFW